MFMLVLHILCHNLVGYESSRGLGTKIAECGYETSKPGYESSGYEKSMGTKRLVTFENIEKFLPRPSELNTPTFSDQNNTVCFLS